MDQTKLELIRHDTAHVMAMSVQELFPETKVTIGPVIENGFFYDFARETPFTEKDLVKIEKKMGRPNFTNFPIFQMFPKFPAPAPPPETDRNTACLISKIPRTRN